MGGVELLVLIGTKLDLGGAFWRVLDRLTDNLSALGHAVIGVFVLTWLAFYLVSRMRGSEALEVSIQASFPARLRQVIHATEARLLRCALLMRRLSGRSLRSRLRCGCGRLRAGDLLLCAALRCTAGPWDLLDLFRLGLRGRRGRGSGRSVSGHGNDSGQNLTHRAVSRSADVGRQRLLCVPVPAVH